MDGKYTLQPHIAVSLGDFPDKLIGTKQIPQFLGIANYMSNFIPKIGVDWRSTLAAIVWWFGVAATVDFLSFSHSDPLFLALRLSLSNWMWVLVLLWIFVRGINARFMVAVVEDCCVVGGDEFIVGLGRLLQMWVVIWWQWVCGCFDSLSQIRCKVLCGFVGEIKRKRWREKKDGKEERGTEFFLYYYFLL